ncbi:MAG: shikimate dehydrogenase, partial [Calditrichaeota bacterium]|nr:shikimate dehydrogenase [Calditrichota bacterium]
VMDVVYNPPETRFLKIARERGCITISGVEMFLLQATKQFELFTGTPVTVEELRAIWENIH